VKGSAGTAGEIFSTSLILSVNGHALSTLYRVKAENEIDANKTSQHETHHGYLRPRLHEIFFNYFSFCEATHKVCEPIRGEDRNLNRTDTNKTDQHENHLTALALTQRKIFSTFFINLGALDKVCPPIRVKT
jgi:hypothetical protein